MPTAVPVALTLLVGGLGGVGFWLIGAPAAFLTGSAVAVVCAVLLGMPARLPDLLRGPALALIGVMMGASVGPDALRDIAALPVGAIGLALATLGATLASYLVLRRVGRWDPLTALCGSIPGAFGLVMALAVEHGARMERVIISQALRLFILVSLIPLVFGSGGGGDAVSAFEEPAGPVEVVAALAVAGGALIVSRLLRFAAGVMIVPLALSAALSASGVIDLHLPGWLGAAAFVVLGASVAARFQTVGGREVLRLAGASLAAFLAAFTVAMSLALVFAQLVDEPLGALFLAFAPGGVDAMIALAFLLGFDVAFVTVMHVARLILLSATIPFVINWADRRYGSAQNSGSAD